MLSPLTTLGFIVNHPLNRGREIEAVGRYIGWQVGSHLKREHIHQWIDGTKLAVRSGMTGATGNVYCGLHEYADMAFVLHLLHTGDTFLDIGANVGSYTVLASGACGARSIAFEPDPETTDGFRRNVAVNAIAELVTLHECALGARDGDVGFTVGRGAGNRVSAQGGRRAPMRRLDGIAGATDAVLMKLDVEGYEAEVLAGASDVLASPHLLAVETENDEPDVRALLQSAGFARRWYDPATRALGQTPLHSENALYVRDDAGVRDRLMSAPYRTVNGRHL
jgi:FkbM family methyltransferase